MKDTEVATLRGLILSPRTRGITSVSARIGGPDAGMGVHVYQRVHTNAALDTLLHVGPDQRLFAVPLRLNVGDVIRQRLPPGDWMLTMLPEADRAPDRILLRVEGARCQGHLLNSPRRWGCQAGPDAAIILYRSFGRVPRPTGTGYFLVRWLFT